MCFGRAVFFSIGAGCDVGLYGAGYSGGVVGGREGFEGRGGRGGGFSFRSCVGYGLRLS